MCSNCLISTYQVGGQVRLHGLPGPASMPVWVRLGMYATSGDTNIQVAADLSKSWPIGGQIVITSSDYERIQTETFHIVNGVLFIHT